MQLSSVGKCCWFSTCFLNWAVIHSFLGKNIQRSFCSGSELACQCACSVSSVARQKKCEKSYFVLLGWISNIASGIKLLHEQGKVCKIQSRFYEPVIHFASHQSPT